MKLKRTSKLLAVVMVMSLLPVTALAAEGDVSLRTVPTDTAH